MVWDRVGTVSPHLFLLVLDYIKTCLRSHRCASDTQIRAVSQNPKVCSETGRSSVEILVGECSPFSNYLMQFFLSHVVSFFLFGVGTPFPRLHKARTISVDFAAKDGWSLSCLCSFCCKRTYACAVKLKT